MAGYEGDLMAANNRIKAWLEKKDKDRKNHKIAPSTYGNYATYVKVHFPVLFPLDTTRIKAGDLQDFYDNLQGKPKQKKNIMDALRNFFRWMLDREEVKRIPKWPEMDPVIERECWTLTYEEQQEILAKIPAEHRDIIEFLMETGLRPAEGCALMKVDIKMSERKGLIRHNYSEAELTERPKQKKEYWIVFSDRAWELVKKNIGNPTSFVFWNAPYRRGYKYKVLNNAWKKTGASVELYEATRHSCWRPSNRPHIQPRTCLQIGPIDRPHLCGKGCFPTSSSEVTVRYPHALRLAIENLLGKRDCFASHDILPDYTRHCNCSLRPAIRREVPSAEKAPLDHRSPLSAKCRHEVLRPRRSKTQRREACRGKTAKVCRRTGAAAGARRGANAYSISQSRIAARNRDLRKAFWGVRVWAGCL